MKKMLTIVGARPQIIKASALSRAIQTEFHADLTELIVHTGQHYDENMSAIFFEELGIPQPLFNLQAGSSSHGRQTALILEGIEKLIEAEKPDALLVYGDTNSTLAAALAASKLEVPVIHIEAGLRSFNKAMPEEINRILCDHVSTLLFCPTPTAIENLRAEGFDLSERDGATIDAPLIYACGDIMYDNSLHFSALSDQNSTILSDHGLTTDGFILVTVHRNANTDDAANLHAIFSALLRLHQSTGLTVVLPLHPRTVKMMHSLLHPDMRLSLDNNENILILPPAGFLDIIALEKNARLVITDSGGLQKEAFFFQKPCVVLRPETEWVEIVENGNAVLAGADEEKIVDAAHAMLAQKEFTFPPIFGNGKAAQFIVQKILEKL
jgi:UDP-GlcNAc3NAcA epimerase